MPYASLDSFKHRVVVATPLPFNVYDTDHTLLLARGVVVENHDRLDALCARGTLVDINEMLSASERVDQASARELPKLWAHCMDQVGQVLLESAAPSFRASLDEAAAPVQQLIARDPDLAIFQVLRQDDQPHLRYGLNHSVHTAIVTQLVAQRLGWPAADMMLAFKAALTMNLGMLELQGVLAAQRSAPTEAQRRVIHEHPQRGVEMLQQAGVTDAVWLTAVAEHHEQRDGTGYPNGKRNPCELATMLRLADVYSAKLSRRATRDAVAADEAGRQIFRQDPGHAATAALVKEFGIYPPGCFVQLASGETGIVVRRGPTVMTPVVAALTSMFGETLTDPLRRDTANPLYAVVGVLGNRCAPPRVAPERLVAMAA